MPAFGLGTFQMQGHTCHAAVLSALALGYRLIDTASVYRNEKEVGAAVDASGIPRSEIFITSKLRPQDHGARAYDAALASLSALGTPFFDLFLVHWPGVAGMKPHAPAQAAVRKETWLAMQRLLAEGKARAIGVSNYTEAHLAELCDAEWCTAKPALNQFELHPLLQQRCLVDECRRRGIAVQAYSSLAQGDKRLLEAPPLVEAAAARGGGVTPAQVALAWALQKGYSVLPRSARAERLSENAGALKVLLSPEEVARIDGLECGARICWNPYTVI
jgi:diketogulonate reductase-like aldo/keto reductase